MYGEIYHLFILYSSNKNYYMETDTMVHTEIGTATDPNALCTLAVTHYNSSLASNVTKNTAKMSFFFTLLYIL